MCGLPQACFSLSLYLFLSIHRFNPSLPTHPASVHILFLVPLLTSATVPIPFPALFFSYPRLSTMLIPSSPLLYSSFPLPPLILSALLFHVCGELATPLLTVRPVGVYFTPTERQPSWGCTPPPLYSTCI